MIVGLCLLAKRAKVGNRAVPSYLRENLLSPYAVERNILGLDFYYSVSGEI
jgi:hypothetical protein